MRKGLNKNIAKAHMVQGISKDLVENKKILYLLRKNVRLFPDRIFLKFYADSGDVKEFSYSEFYKRVKKFASYLAFCNYPPGTKIATFLHNYYDTVTLYFSAWWVGFTVVPFNVKDDIKKFEYIIKDSDIKMIFTLKEYLKLLEPVSAYRQVIPMEEMELDKDFDTRWLRNKENVTIGNVGMIIYTSGTTGNPKGVVLTQRNLVTDAKYISEWHRLVPGDVMFCVLPIHHVNGTVVTLVTPMYYGGTVILSERFHSHLFFKIIKKEKVKIVSVVPTILQFLLHSHKKFDISKIKSFSHIICGAGPLTSQLARKFEDKFKMRIVHGYGLSETTCYSCFIPIDLNTKEHIRWQTKYGFPSIGIPLKCNEMDIQDENGSSKKEGERGEIVIRGQNVMKYYYDNEEANNTAFKNGWFKSGDEGLFKYDKNGNKYFFITGRIKELIIRGGVNISPLEIDEVLSTIEYIKSGIAVGFENIWYGEEVGAVVVLKEKFTKTNEKEIKEKILKYCSEKLSHYKSPKLIEFSESIPVTATGKYQRNKLKHLFEKYKEIQFK